jgi:hypothetical protein
MTSRRSLHVPVTCLLLALSSACSTPSASSAPAAAAAPSASTSDPAAPVELETTGTARTTADQFGTAIAVSGDGRTAFVGAPGPRAASQIAASERTVYVFVRRGATFEVKAELHDEATVSFGASLATNSDGTRVIVGFADGVAELAWDGTELREVSRVSVASIASPCVALSANGELLVAGTIEQAHVFARTEHGFEEFATLDAEGCPRVDRMGSTIVLPPGGVADRTSVVVVTRAGRTLTTQTIEVDHAPTSAAISGDGGTLAIASVRIADDGEVRVFRSRGGKFVPLTTLRGSGQPSDYFGDTLAFTPDGKRLLVSTTWGGVGVGSIDVFEDLGDRFDARATLRPDPSQQPNAAPGSSFGTVFATADDVVLVGAPWGIVRPGAVFAFALPPG